MKNTHDTLVESIMTLPILKAEWVLWLLLGLSVLSLGIILERAYFFSRKSVGLEDLRARVSERMSRAQRRDTEAFLRTHDALESNVLLYGLCALELGPDAVEEVTRAALSRERHRYERALTVLAIVGSNAPFIGLFGTVLGIIHAFASLSQATQGTSKAVMSGVSEALVATAVGLLVAIPAVSAFNFFKAKLKVRVERADELVRSLLALLKSEPVMVSDEQAAA